MKPNLRISIQTLLDGGKAQREIARVIGVDRKTIRRIVREAKSPGVATGICAEKAAEARDVEQIIVRSHFSRTPLGYLNWLGAIGRSRRGSSSESNYFSGFSW